MRRANSYCQNARNDNRQQMLQRLQQPQQPMRRNTEPQTQTHENIDYAVTDSLISDSDNPEFTKRYGSIAAVIGTRYELTNADVTIEAILKSQKWAQSVKDIQPYLDKLEENGRIFSTHDPNHFRPTRN